MEAIALPGHGLPLTARAEDCFPTALFENHADAPLTTVREFTMIEIMNRISDKADWHIKVFDDGIISKWRAETLSKTERDVSRKMFDECIAELQYKAGIFKDTSFVEALNGVFKSDTLVPEDLRLALIDAVKPLENVPEDQKDWHPGSDGKVLDLVHPSLYPLVYGRTKLLPLTRAKSQAAKGLDAWRSHFGLGDLSVVQGNDLEGHEEEGTWSARFQWLPCDVDVSGNEPKIVSYINNLHTQKHHRLYSIVEKLVQRSITLWDATLSAIDNIAERPARVIMRGNGYGEPTLPEPLYTENGDSGSSWSEKYQAEEDAWKDSRPIIQPEPDPFKPYTPECSVKLRQDWDDAGHRLQIIVKLANIYLTPSSPNYDGGTWHVEGAANESICASAIYYYQSENISESLLSFRQRIYDDIYDLNYEQDDHRALETIFGLGNGDPLMQNLGKVVTRQGRLIAFSNALQHRVEPFHLEDATKPGYRKILAFFLVDPHQRIISTAHVAPQQPEWWEEHLKLSELATRKLPQELKDAVQRNFPPMMDLEEAKKHRQELMDERSFYLEDSSVHFANGREFSLCEH